MNKLYTTLLTATLPLWLLRLRRRAKTLPAYRERWDERFGKYQSAPFASHQPLTEKTIWIHTVSVGEFLAARPLIKALLAAYPETTMVITTTTPTGSEQVVKTFGEQVQHVYIPFDLPWMLKRFIKHFQPKICLIMETELWPNMLAVLKKNDIPSVFVNARLSARSAKSYLKIKKTVRRMMQNITQIIVQNKDDGQRFVGLGLDQNKLTIAGNIKFDMPVPEGIAEKAKDMANHLGKGDRPMWVVASTHEGEEALILKSFANIKKDIPNCLLCLVPRHPDRFDHVYNLCQNAGFKVGRRSQENPLDAECDIAIGDSMGEMMVYYAAADVTFVGGSLIPIGGHNLIEPALLSLPILTGPNMQNFLELKNLMVAADAVIICDNENIVADQVIDILKNPEQAKALGQRAEQVAEDNRGALEKHLDKIHGIIR